MIITTENGTRIEALEGNTIEWDEFHKRFYLWGFRWIKSKGRWSNTLNLHNFEKYEVEA